MSVKLMALVFDARFRDIEFLHTVKKKTGEEAQKTIRVLASTAKWVAVALADHANDEGEGAYPSVGRLAKKTELSEISVIAALKALKSAGIVTYVGLSKRNTSNYTVNKEKLLEMATWERVRPAKKGKAALPQENEGGKATLPQGVKPLYQGGKAALPESSLTVPNHHFSANALEEIGKDIRKEEVMILGSNPDAPTEPENPTSKEKVGKGWGKPGPPPSWGAGWQMAAGVDVTLPDRDQQAEIALINALNLFHEHEQPFVKTFYLGTGILPVKEDVAYWRKGIAYLRSKGVTTSDVSEAISQAARSDMTISSPQSLKNIAPAVHAKNIKKAAVKTVNQSNDFSKHLDNFVPRREG